MENKVFDSVSKDPQPLDILQLQSRIRQLEAHVVQLKNVIAKNNSTGATLNTNSGKKKKANRSFDFSKYNTRHVALKVAYLGWDYQGFAAQEDTDKTIEAAIFKALLQTKLIESRETSNYHRCGRTDKGVSALGQVISIDLRTNLLAGCGVKVREKGSAHERPGNKETEIQYVHILNKVLPPEIRVLAWCPVQPDFSARFSCIKRTYKYYFPMGDMNLQMMTEAGQKLVGEHDYRNFCKMDVGNGVIQYTRRIMEVSFKVLDSNDCSGYSMVELTVVGQAFLWHQIRCIVAVLFLIGQGKEQPEVIDELLNVEKYPRKPQYTMASELPLVLYDCEYEGIKFIYDEDTHRENLRHFHEQWTQHIVRSTVVRGMLGHLEEQHPLQHTEEGASSTQVTKEPMKRQCESLLPGHRPRVYLPLLQRQTCESLEERIEHYAKRRKTASSQTQNTAQSEINVNSPKSENPDSQEHTTITESDKIL